MILPKTRGRDPAKRSELTAFVRRQILSGEWAPGAKIPPRTWFEKTFSAAPITVQNAFALLREEALIVCEPRKATRVSPAPPHLNRYGLVLYGTDRLENFFSRSLALTAKMLSEKHGLDVRVYFDLDCRQDSPDHRELLLGLRNHWFAGLFFASSPDQLRGTPILEAPGVPRVILSDKLENGAPQSLRIGFPNVEISRQALNALAQNGARRVALLIPATSGDPLQRARLRAEMEHLGLDCPNDWYIELHSRGPHFVSTVVELLFNRRNKEIPDGLFVGDDNFLPFAIEGLHRALGAEAEKRVFVVSHANYPTTLSVDFPVRYIYVNILSALERSIDAMKALRRGEKPQPIEFEIMENQTKKRTPCKNVVLL